MKLNKIINITLITVIVSIVLILWLSMNFKTSLLFVGLLSFLTYIHIMLTSLSNVLIGQAPNVNGDTFWKTILIFLNCIIFSIYFSI